jgi:hypothetical protein
MTVAELPFPLRVRCVRVFMLPKRRWSLVSHPDKITLIFRRQLTHADVTRACRYGQTVGLLITATPDRRGLECVPAAENGQ